MDQQRKGCKPKLITPYYPEEREDKAYFNNPSSDVKLVSNYTGLDFYAVEDMEIFEYYGYLHDAVVWGCSKTRSGREYLENAYYYSQTEPDRKALREFGGG